MENNDITSPSERANDERIAALAKAELAAPGLTPERKDELEFILSGLGDKYWNGLPDDDPDLVERKPGAAA